METSGSILERNSRIWMLLQRCVIEIESASKTRAKFELEKFSNSYRDMWNRQRSQPWPRVVLLPRSVGIKIHCNMVLQFESWVRWMWTLDLTATCGWFAILQGRLERFGSSASFLLSMVSVMILGFQLQWRWLIRNHAWIDLVWSRHWSYLIKAGCENLFT